MIIFVINLFIDFGINSTFNVDCLVDYKDLDVISLVNESSHKLILESLFLSPLPDILPYIACQVDKFLMIKLSPRKMVRFENI